MQSKKLILIMGALALFVGGAAFVAGRMLNQKVGPVGPGGPLGGNGGGFSLQLVPAEELPKTAPEVTGQFVERKDNTTGLTQEPCERSVSAVADEGTRIANHA